MMEHPAITGVRAGVEEQLAQGNERPFDLFMAAATTLVRRGVELEATLDFLVWLTEERLRLDENELWELRGRVREWFS